MSRSIRSLGRGPRATAASPPLDGAFRKLLEESGQPMWIEDPNTAEVLAMNASALARESAPEGTDAPSDPAPVTTAHSTLAPETFGTIQRTTFEFGGRQLVLVQMAEPASVAPMAEEPTSYGLVSRTEFLAQLRSALARPSASVAVVYLGLDRFRAVNAALGHAVGIEVLEEVVERLERISEGQFAIASFGTDEFALSLTEVGDLAEVFAVAERVRWELTKPFHTDEDEVSLGASIGVAFGRGNEIGAEMLLQQADGAALRAREGGGNRVGTFEPRIGLRALTRVRGDAPLRRALERSEFHLHYQPVVSLTASPQIGIEALIRWGTPETRMIMPNNFIPLSEETGFIVPLGAWAFREACEQLARWSSAGIAHAPSWISVNLSARQLYVQESVESFEQTVRETGVRPEQVVLEITESALMDETPLLWQALQRLRELGIQFSLDDFGTRYSSLAYLRRFDFDTVKIDRSFISDIETDARDATIVESVISLSHGLGLDVVVEGVETSGQLDRIRALGADWAQGYHLSRPIPAEEIPDMLVRLVEIQRQFPGHSQRIGA